MELASSFRTDQNCEKLDQTLSALISERRSRSVMDVQRIRNSIHPHYNGVTFEEVELAKKMFIQHIADLSSVKEFKDLVKKGRKVKDFVIYSTRKMDNVFNKVSAFALLSNESDWTDLETELFVGFDNVSLKLIRRQDSAEIHTGVIATH